MLRFARLLGASERVTYLEGAAESVPLPGASATVAWSLSSVHHWPDIDRAVAEVLRLLESRGRFVVIEHRARPGATGVAGHGWTGDQGDAFASICRTAGFVDVHIVRADSG